MNERREYQTKCESNKGAIKNQPITNMMSRLVYCLAAPCSMCGLWEWELPVESHGSHVATLSLFPWGVPVVAKIKLTSSIKNMKQNHVVQCSRYRYFVMQGFSWEWDDKKNPINFFPQCWPRTKEPRTSFCKYSSIQPQTFYTANIFFTILKNVISKLSWKYILSLIVDQER